MDNEWIPPRRRRHFPIINPNRYHRRCQRTPTQAFQDAFDPEISLLEPGSPFQSSDNEFTIDHSEGHVRFQEIRAKSVARFSAISSQLKTLHTIHIVVTSRILPLTSKSIRRCTRRTRESSVQSAYPTSPPVHRLPDEILAEIFTLTKSGGPDRVGNSFIWLLSTVCARWRDVACGCSRLWSTFAFALSGKQGSVNLLKSTLDRCRSADISVDVANDLRGIVSKVQEQRAVRKIEMLAASAQSIVKLRFEGPEGSFDLSSSFSGFRGRLPRLEVFGFTHSWRAFGQSFSDAPKLHTLIMPSSFEGLEMRATLPIAQIQQIGFGFSTSGYHLVPFDNLTSMVSIQTYASHPVALAIAPPSALRNLSTWQVEFPLPETLPQTPLRHSDVHFFARFITPALRVLHVRRLTSIHGILDLCRVSECELHSLVLEDLLVSTDDLVRLLTKLPSLQSLGIFAGGLDLLNDQLFDALALRDDPGKANIMPLLTEFLVDGSYYCETGSLVTMLESRTAGLSSSASSTMYLKTADIGMVGERMVRRLKFAFSVNAALDSQM
ncbi:hypothetical protein R3P38DRAFT_3252981 [Favolaschia claudopus]|uniref:F-box domain-containing protein n=1 Tax=Favolaschia claudopus TaxID=2862362 RepID=A0AAW0DYT2_9AGAR